jgi:hypothetical protein
VFALALLIAPTMAHALAPVVEFSLRDGPIPNGVADDLILAPDTNFGRVFQSATFDAETYVEFSLVGASIAPEVRLALGVSATDFDLVYGESKTFKVSAYTGTGTASLDAFGLGSLLESITLPTNSAYDLELDVTDAWNAAVTAGDSHLGIRIHDPVWTGTLIGAGTVIYGSSDLTVVPEPGTGLLVGLGLAAAGVHRRRRGGSATGAVPDASSRR